MRWPLFAYLLALQLLAKGQTTIPFSFRQVFDVPVSTMSNEILPNPWTGGFNAPQLQEVDFNRDGIKEILVLDRAGNRLSVFETLNNRQSWVCNYTYTKQIPNLSDWFLVRDYNADGIEDIFCSNYSGIAVYRGYVDENNRIAFEQVSELLYSTYFQSPLNLYVSRADIPAIADVDADGDLDVLTFYILGTCIEYHRNLSVENGYAADSLIFRLESDNWGLITESSNDNSINYNDSCGRGGERHSGSTLLLHDLDLDSDLDLILGDVSYNNPLFLINQPLGPTDVIVPQPLGYPSEIWQSAGVPVFPGLFSLQSNNDTAVDLLIAPNTEQQSANAGRTIRRYRSLPGSTFAFTAPEEPFLCHETLDFGQYSAPALGDIDGDGDLDLVVGNSGLFSNGAYTSSLAIFENTGTLFNASFKQIASDVLGLSAQNRISISPTLADLNNDAKADLVLGFYDGTFALYFSDGAFGFTQAASSSIGGDAGDWANPEIVDVNTDGKKDLIAGSKQGNIKLFLNLGTASNPQFSSEASPWYGSSIETVEEGISNYGYAAPRFSVFQGDTFLLSGSERGSLFIWKQENGQLLPADSVFLSIDEGGHSTVATGDLNGDGFLELIAGNRAGGLTYSVGQMPTSQENWMRENSVRIVPNPVQNFIAIQGLHESVELEIWNAIGLRVCTMHLNADSLSTVDIGQWADGLYFFQIQSSKGRYLQKVIIKN